MDYQLDLYTHQGLKKGCNSAHRIHQILTKKLVWNLGYVGALAVYIDKLI